MTRAVVRWDNEAKRLVGPSGEAVTDAQGYKADRMVDLGLIRWTTRTDQVEGVPGRVFEVDPLPGNSLSYEVVRCVDRGGGVVYACGCQRARGTERTDAKLCSHVLAVSRYVRGEGSV